MIDIEGNIAVIDLGTNTFHLLIVNISKSRDFKLVHRERIFVKLGAEGLHPIGKKIFDNALDAIGVFNKYLKKHQVERIKIYGTEALRSASNGRDFIREVLIRYSLAIQLISGQEEARLIYLGIREAVIFNIDYSLIMDIGGGSVEFIIANQDGMVWAESYPIGIAVLKNQFSPEPSLSKLHRNNLIEFLDVKFAELKLKIKAFNVRHLIGASGTFDVIEGMIQDKTNANRYSSQVSINKFKNLSEHLSNLNYQQLLKTPGISTERAELISVALVLINCVLEINKFDFISVSSFALKEGMLQEMLKQA